jgi:hypothetical protein
MLMMEENANVLTQLQIDKQFNKKGFVVIEGMISDSQAAFLYDYTLKHLNEGNLDDGQVPGSPSFYQDQEIVKLQKKLFPFIEKHINIKLIPIFCYHRVYRQGAILRMHKDSTRAEISLTMNLGQMGKPWDLWLVDYEENANRITLNPGDALIYNGNKLHHWRGQLIEADLVSQIMFHYAQYSLKNIFMAKFELIRRARKKLREWRGISY